MLHRFTWEEQRRGRLMPFCCGAVTEKGIIVSAAPKLRRIDRNDVVGLINYVIQKGGTWEVYREGPGAITEFQGEFRWLSNFIGPQIKIASGDGGVLKSSCPESAFQALKTINVEERRRIATLPAGAARKAGRNVVLRPGLREKRVLIMYQILRQKYAHPQYRERLLSTGLTPIREGNTWGDSFWGYDLKKGEGKNIMGKLTMLVREEIGG